MSGYTESEFATMLTSDIATVYDLADEGVEPEDVNEGRGEIASRYRVVYGILRSDRLLAAIDDLYSAIDNLEEETNE